MAGGRGGHSFGDPIRMPRLKNVHMLATDLIAPTSLSTLNMMEAAAMGTRAVHVAHGPPGYRARTQLVEPTHDCLRPIAAMKGTSFDIWVGSNEGRMGGTRLPVV